MLVQVRSAPTVQVRLQARSGDVYLTAVASVLTVVVFDEHLFTTTNRDAPHRL